MKKKDNLWDSKKFFIINANVFDTDIAFCINANEQEIKDWLKKESGDKWALFSQMELDGWDTSKTVQGRMIPFGGGFVVLVKSSKDHFRNTVGVLVHEIVHVTQYLLKDREIPLTTDTEEIYAYLTEFLTREALLKLY